MHMCSKTACTNLWPETGPTHALNCSSVIHNHGAQCQYLYELIYICHSFTATAKTQTKTACLISRKHGDVAHPPLGIITPGGEWWMVLKWCIFKWANLVISQHTATRTGISCAFEILTAPKGLRLSNFAAPWVPHLSAKSKRLCTNVSLGQVNPNPHPPKSRSQVTSPYAC